MEFYLLQVNSIYDYLGSGLGINEYTDGLLKYGYEGGAITDLSSLNGIFAYATYFKAKGRKFIPAVKLNLIYDEGYFDLLFYIHNEEAYLSLLSLLSLKKTTYTIEELLQLSSCSVVLKTNSAYFYSGEFESRYQQLLRRLIEHFDDFYLGIEIYSSLEEEFAATIRSYAANHSLRLVAIPLVLYPHKRDAYRYELLTAIKNKRVVKEQFTSANFILSPEVLAKLYTEEEINNTAVLAKRCNFDPLAIKGSVYDLYPEAEANDRLKEKVHQRLKALTTDKAYLDRVNYELDVIFKMGFSSYFLLVADYVNYAKTSDIKVGPGRGSVASSLVAYLLDITEVDPLKYDLVFERFLNPDRVSMPDIDIDFEDTKKTLVIDYLKKTYGDSHVAAITTYSSLQAASALNAVGEARKIPLERIKRLTSNLIPGVSLEESKKRSYALGSILQDPYYQEIFADAQKVEGFIVNASKHAAGVIITGKNLPKLLPFSNGTVNVEYSYLEKMGFLKFDVLGLANLSFIRSIEEKITASGRELPDLTMDLDNEECYKILCSGATYSLFQLESEGMKRAIKLVKPSCFNDLVALLALYRPGPMDNIPLFSKNKANPEGIDYLDPSLEPILKETYGVIVYQEQLLKILVTYAGFSPAEADIFRRLISKKKSEEMKDYEEKFRLGATKNNKDPLSIKKLYSHILRFAEYGFNKAHSVSYAYITYRLLYYKTHFPLQFYDACFEKESLTRKTASTLIEEFKAFGYELKGPDIFNSKEGLNIVDNKIYLPFKLIKGLKEDFIKRLVGLKRDFMDLFDFFAKSYHDVNSEKDYQRLIDSGALDPLDKRRAMISENIDELIMAGLADDSSNRPILKESPTKKVIDYYREAEALGTSLSHSLISLTKNDLAEDEILFLITGSDNYSRSQYSAINDLVSASLSFSKSEDLANFSLLAAKGRFSRNQKRFYVDSYRIKEEL